MTPAQSTIKIKSLQIHLEKTEKQLASAEPGPKADWLKLEVKRTKNKIDSLKF